MDGKLRHQTAGKGRASRTYQSSDTILTVLIEAKWEESKALIQGLEEAKRRGGRDVELRCGESSMSDAEGREVRTRCTLLLWLAARFCRKPGTGASIT